MKTLGVIVVVAITISFGITTNVFGQGQQNVTKIIMDQTNNIPQCSLVEQARGLGLNTSLFSNVTEFNACIQVIYESPDRVVLTGDSYHISRRIQYWNMESNRWTGNCCLVGRKCSHYGRGQ